MVIQVDSREKGNQKILEYFDSIGQKYIKSKMYAGDYQNVNSVKVLIDRKDSLVELAGNLCRTTEHIRVKHEIEKAQEIGCERLVFLVADERVRSTSEVGTWNVPKRENGNPYTRVSPVVLQKIMMTIEERYPIVKFLFVKKKEMGQAIMELLSE